MNITIKNGIDNTLRTQVADGTTVASILSNAGFQAALRFSGNDHARVNGWDVEGSRVLVDGDEVSIERAACSKA